MHLSIGQEAAAVGSCMELSDADLITSTHRGHGHCIAKGADPARMFAEFFGKQSGYCKGRGGSMHMADVSKGNLGANGIVGGGIPIAVGAALALKKQKSGNVVLCFFGDGANNEGAFHEALNMASVWKLPVVFICENNLYGMSTSTEKSTAVPNIADRASAYAMPGVITDGNDFADVAEAVSAAIARARAGEGPSLIEHKTYRIKGHSKSDRNRYRTKDEIKSWQEKDPIGRFEAELLAFDLITQDEAKTIADEAKAITAKAIEDAQLEADPSVASLTDYVYAKPLGVEASQ